MTKARRPAARRRTSVDFTLAEEVLIERTVRARLNERMRDYRGPGRMQFGHKSILAFCKMFEETSRH